MTRLTIRSILNSVAAHYDVSRDLLLSEHRPRWISQPRHVGMYLARRLTTRSERKIGRHFARHSTSVRHAVRSVDARRLTDPDLDHDIATLSALLAPISESADG